MQKEHTLSFCINLEPLNFQGRNPSFVFLENLRRPNLFLRFSDLYTGVHTTLVNSNTHGLRTPREEIAFTTRPKIQSQSQIFRYGRSIFCLPYWPNFSDIFDLCLHWVSVVRDIEQSIWERTDPLVALTQEQIWSKDNFYIVYLFIAISGTILLRFDEKSLWNLHLFLSGLIWPQHSKDHVILVSSFHKLFTLISLRA